MFKRQTAFLLAAALAAGAAFLPARAETYYNDLTVTPVTKGAALAASRRVVDGGLLDVFTLAVPVGDPYISLAPVDSAEYGLKETTTSLLTNAGAVAGVNGDFFGVSGNYSVPLGLEIDGAKWSVANNEEKQAGENAGATFMISQGGAAFMGYVTTEVRLFIGGKEFTPCRAVNKTVDGQYPVILTNDYIQDTAALDKRVPGLVKVFVSDAQGRIARVSKKGETVLLPADPGAFIILLSGEDYDKYSGWFSVGLPAHYTVRANVDVNKVKAAISGGGLILAEGQAVKTGEVVSASTRQPRTAIGISRDGQTVYLMVVDGRTHSVGATHEEMAALMKEAGAWSAMHLDGGGSSTMAVMDDDLGGLAVVNTPSEGASRKVINALGLFVSAPAAGVSSIELTGADAQLPGELDLTMFGYDPYRRRTTLTEGVKLQCATATVTDNIVSAPPGVHTVTGYWGYANARKTVRVIDVAEITPNMPAITTMVGSPKRLGFTARDAEGFAAVLPADRVAYELSPPDIGLVSADGQFMATRLGRGVIKCTYGGAAAYIEIDATIEAVVARPLDSLDGLRSSAYPTAIPNGMDVRDAYNGRPAVRLNYEITSRVVTQAAYMNLNVQNYALGYRVAVNGDESGHWLRAKVTDAAGKEYTLDFARNIDWLGWRDCDAWLPQSAAQPVTLTQIYAVTVDPALDNGPHSLGFANLRTFYSAASRFEPIEIPKAEKAADPLRIDGGDAGGGDITVNGSLDYAGKKTPAGYAENRAKAEKALTKASSDKIFTVSMSGLNGGFAKTDGKQYWAKAAAMASGCPIIVIQTDINPASLGAAEYALFHGMWRDAAARGKTVFVVSTRGAETAAAILDGVRYISLGQLYNGDALNADFGVLRLRVNGDTVQYGIQRVFP